MKFQKAISKQDIQTFIESKNSAKTKIIQNIQNLKENSIKRLKEGFSNENIKFIDPILVKGVEKEYLNLLKQQSQVNPKIDEDQSRKEIEAMFKKEHFNKEYIEKFQKYASNKYIEIPKQKLFERKTKLITKKDRDAKEDQELQDINNFLILTEPALIENTKSREIQFDANKIKETKDKFNCQCFFEQDQLGNKNYFSLNELINDLETFGVECGYPKINGQQIDQSFNNAQKFIKVALLKNILRKYRDYQEIMIYNFKDYEKLEGDDKEHANRNGILAEKIVERYFRNLANKDDFSIKIEKASIGEDQNNKVDLIISIQDKKTGINIKKELQLTVNHNEQVLQNKRLQIIKQKEHRHTDLDLLELELSMLDQKMVLRRNLQRPIGGINELLSIEDKDFLEETYKKIVGELLIKKQNSENLDSPLIVNDGS